MKENCNKITSETENHNKKINFDNQYNQKYIRRFKALRQEIVVEFNDSLP